VIVCNALNRKRAFGVSLGEVTAMTTFTTRSLLSMLGALAILAVLNGALGWAVVSLSTGGARGESIERARSIRPEQ
jgi:hypothetical protein